MIHHTISHNQKKQATMTKDLVFFFKDRHFGCHDLVIFCVKFFCKFYEMPFEINHAMTHIHRYKRNKTFQIAISFGKLLLCTS